MTVPVQDVTSYTATTTITATGGSGASGLIAAIVGWGSSSATMTNVKLGTTALTQAVFKSGNQLTAFLYTWIFYLENCPSGGTSLAITSSGLTFANNNNGGGIRILEIPGKATLDKTASASGSSTAASSGSTAALSTSNEFAVGLSRTFNTTSTQPSGWNNIPALGNYISCGYKNVTDGSAQSYDLTQSSSAGWAAVLASFITGSVAPSSSSFAGMFP
jgi:hypothetical protein